MFLEGVRVNLRFKGWEELFIKEGAELGECVGWSVSLKVR